MRATAAPVQRSLLSNSCHITHDTRVTQECAHCSFHGLLKKPSLQGPILERLLSFGPIHLTNNRACLVKGVRKWTRCKLEFSIIRPFPGTTREEETLAHASCTMMVASSARLFSGVLVTTALLAAELMVHFSSNRIFQVKVRPLTCIVGLLPLVKPGLSFRRFQSRRPKIRFIPFVCFIKTQFFKKRY